MNGYRYNFFYGVDFYILLREVVVKRVAAKSQCECACVCEELNELSCDIERKTRNGEHTLSIKEFYLVIVDDFFCSIDGFHTSFYHGDYFCYICQFLLRIQ